jgi:hypothetical protein
MALDDLTNHDFNEEARRLINEKEGTSSTPESTPKPVSLGKAAGFLKDEEMSNNTVIEDIGWIRVKLETLPSQGIFYPEGTEITIRAAGAGEIRHWSTLDEEDLLSLDDALNRVADKCCKIRFPRTMGSFKDLKEIDRFFIVFAIREYTFKQGENQLNVTFACKNCGKADTRSIIKEMLTYYTPSEELQLRFSSDERCFHLKLNNGEDIKLYLPSLGVMGYIKTFLREKAQTKEDYDQAFLKWAPFLFSDHRLLNNASYNKLLQDSYAWSLDKISVIDWFVDQMQKTVKAELKNDCSGCGTEVVAPLNFRGGIKSIFLISDISSKLL